MKIIERLKWKVSVWNRTRKLDFFCERMSEGDRIIDIGVMPLNDRNGAGTNYLEEYFLVKGYPIDALAKCTEGEEREFDSFKEHYRNCRLLFFDGMDFPAVKKPYDIALCNAVIEHVGTRETQRKWLERLRPICRKLIITTPNRYCPIEAHTNTFLRHIVSKRFRDWLSTEHNLNLFSLKEFQEILEASGFRVVEIKKNKLLFCTLDFVIVCQ